MEGFSVGSVDDDSSESLPSPTVVKNPSAEKTLLMEKSVRNGLAWAELSVKAQKTKKSSNKGKESASVAGSIVKLLDKFDSTSNGNLTGQGMTVMIMQQLEEMNRGMARYEREERQEKKRKKKHCQKCQKKKRLF